MRRLTHLGRTLSLAYPQHRVLLALVAVGAAGAWAYPGGNSPAAAMALVAGTVAVVWMLVRETGPEKPNLALLGAAAAGGTALSTGSTDLAALVSLMLAARLMTRSTGLVALLTDVVAIGVFAGIFARTPLAWAAGLAVASAVALDTNHAQPAPARHTWLALAVGVAVTISAVFSGALDVRWGLPGWWTVGLALVAAAALATAPSSSPVRNDVGEPFDPGRLRATRLLVLLAVALGTVAGGAVYEETTWPAWIAVAAAGVNAHLASRRSPVR